jgi:hypothetical protein
MSKGGGAGKVYFVLYLAVVLELLIIIVERDEAEENLLKKQRETMKIVESILSQLQSGAGTEGINTRPQDEITIPPQGVNVKEILGADVKAYRRYIVDVGVTDVAAELKRKEGETMIEYAKRLNKLIKLGNVEEIEYQIFYNSSQDPNNPPRFLTDEEIRKLGLDFEKFEPGQTIQTEDGEVWELLSLRKLKLDSKKIMDGIKDFNKVSINDIDPVYPPDLMTIIGPSYAPPGQEDSVFYYIKRGSMQQGKTTLLKRSFEVNFQPPRRAGWYKLRFASRTNRILGVHGNVKATNIPDDATINIGTVSLTAKDLKKVMKELTNKLDQFNLPTFEMLAVDHNLEGYEKQLQEAKQKAINEADNPTEVVGKIKLYDYIVKLLTPNMSINFAQNRGAIEINARVILPEVKAAKPIISMPTYTPTFDKLPAAFQFTASPWMGNNILEGKVIDPATNSVVARINFTPLDEIDPNIPMPQNGQKRDYLAKVDQTLSPGKYKMLVTHRISAQVKEEEGTLEVFPTGLTDNSKKMLDARMEILYYGKVFPPVSAEPSSGGKIKPEHFRIYLTTDKESQRPYIQGLTITRDNSVYFDCQVNEVSLRITWVQPYTGEEIDVYPKNTKKIRQAAPRVNTADVQTTVDELGTNRLKVTIRGIRVVAPSDGKTETSKAKVVVKVDKKVSLGKLAGQGVSQYSDPVVSKDGNTYKVEFTLDVRPPKGLEMIKGSASVKLLVQAINTCDNSKTSTMESKKINAGIKYEVQTGGRGGRSSRGKKPSSKRSGRGGRR